MPPAAAITDLEALKDRAPLAGLLAWNRDAVRTATLDRDELTVMIERESLREACTVLRDGAGYNFLCDITCVDWHPVQPRFEVVYHLLAMESKSRVRLKLQVREDDPSVDSLTDTWPAANFFEREVFDLFGVRFSGHPSLRRIMMPEDWKGHPLRKDYPVEGYR
jgi:NADH-quinone oxidoreductase subunit C